MQSYYYVDNGDPVDQMASIKAMLSDIIDHVRTDMEEVQEPEARTLFRTTAEVLQGLVIVYDTFERRSARLAEVAQAAAPTGEGVLSQ